MLVSMLSAVGFAALALVSPPDAAPWLIEEFFLARNAHPQERHEVQVTWSLEHAREDDVAATDIGLEVEYGITDRLQLEAELPWQRLRPAGEEASSAFGNVETGLMYAFARGPRRMLSAGVDVELPTAESGEGADTQVEPFVIVGRAIGRGEAHASFSHGLRESHESAWDVAGVAPYRNWRGTLELNGRRDDGSTSVRITPGVMWKGLRGYEVGVAMPVGLRNAPRAGIVVKIDAEF
jgi:hypothetical protein